MLKVFFSGYAWWYDDPEKIGCGFGWITFPFHEHKNHDRRNPVRTVGDFYLEHVDEIAYLRTGKTTHIKKLYPCADSDPEVTFPKLIIEHEIGSTKIRPEDCYISIDNSENPIFIFAEANELDTTINSDFKKNKTAQKDEELSERATDQLDSLEKFIKQFEIARKHAGLCFDKCKMLCNEKQLLAALQKWAKNRDKKTQELWDIKKLSNLDIWSSQKRKVICELLKQGNHHKAEKDFFEIVGF